MTKMDRCAGAAGQRMEVLNDGKKDILTKRRPDGQSSDRREQLSANTNVSRERIRDRGGGRSRSCKRGCAIWLRKGLVDA